MSYDPGALRAALAAAVGDDPALIADLSGVFRKSVSAHRDALGLARTASDWCGAAWRLEGIAASFGAVILMDAANAAGSAAVGDANILARIDAAIAGYGG